MTRKSLYALTAAALIAVPVAAPVLASEVSPGLAQQAQLLGVAPGSLSGTDLVALDVAVSKGDQQAINFILSGKSNASGVGVVTPGKAQIAALLGVNPADYTLSDLVGLQEAVSEGDAQAVAAIKAAAGRTGAASRGISPGHAQLAALLGVNPADYTLTELVALDARRSDSEN